MQGFLWWIIALTAAPAVLLARESWRYGAGAILFLLPHSAALLVLDANFRGILGADTALLWSVQAGLVLLHGAFIATFITNFILIRAPLRRQMLYIVPGQYFFVVVCMYIVFYAGRGLGNLFGAEFAAASVAGGIPFGIAAAAMLTTHSIRRVGVSVPVAGLRAPIRILQLSDIHVSHYMDDKRLGDLAQRVNAEEPELIAMTGDFVTLQSEHDYTPLLRFIEALDRPPLGMFACLGNHDLPIADVLSQDMEKRGVRMLRNESEVVTTPAGDRLRVAGLKFYWRSRRRHYADAFRRAVGEHHEPVLLLCHEPAAFDFLPEDWRGLMMAGHLHGGQFGLASLGLHLSVLSPSGAYDQGLFHRDEAWLYSHRGTGVYGFPVRMGIPAEMALVTLEPAENLARESIRARAARRGAPIQGGIVAAQSVEAGWHRTSWRAVASRLLHSTPVRDTGRPHAGEDNFDQA
jgi:uncharacterized protein